MTRSPQPQPQSAAVIATMKGNRRVNTKPELRLRSLLHRRGLRYRTDFKVQAGGVTVRPDIVFTRRRVAVFVDGCFWHRCPDHGTTPRSNSWYWEPKLARNQERDKTVSDGLAAGGWTVVRVWEHTDPADAADMVAAVVSSAEA